MPRQEFFSKAGLKSRGWTDTLIKQVLGPHDKEDVNQHYKSGPTVKLFLRERVEKAEATEPRVQKAIARHPEKLAEHQQLVEKRDRKFAWNVRLKKLGFSLRISYEGEVAICVAVRVGSRHAMTAVYDEAFTLLARSAYEVDEAAPVIDWLLENQAGDRDFRDLLTACMGGKAKQIQKEDDERRQAEIQQRQEEYVRRTEAEAARKAKQFTRKAHLGDFLVTARYDGERLSVQLKKKKHRNAGVTVADEECIRLAKECRGDPTALLTRLAEAKLGNERMRAAVAYCLHPGEETQAAWREACRRK